MAIGRTTEDQSTEGDPDDKLTHQFENLSLGFQNKYEVQNQWCGHSAPWHPGGLWVLGCRPDQKVVAVHITSDDFGNTFTGTMTYAREGPSGFQATLISPNEYEVETQWGGPLAPWQSAGVWLMGCRTNQNVVAVDISSNDGGQTFFGTMTYTREGPIGFKATLVPQAELTETEVAQEN